jgi:hypothetical protein
MAKAKSKPSTKSVDPTPKGRDSRAQEDTSPMVDAGWDTQGLPISNPDRIENLRLQMVKRGVDMSTPAPISRLNPEVFGKTLTKQSGVGVSRNVMNRPFRGPVISKEVTGRKTFKNFVGSIISRAKSLIAPKPEYGGEIAPPRAAKKNPKSTPAAAKRKSMRLPEE